MPARENPPGPAVDPDPVMTTRREALSEALRSGGHQDPPRSYSTLAERSDGEPDGLDECAYCESLIRSIVSHLTGHVVIERYPHGYHALLAAVDRFKIES